MANSLNETMYLTIFFVVILLSNSCNSLECYVCDNQEDNRGKCVTSIKTCDYGEDICLTELKWGSTPYWQEGALKQYYISKRCSTKNKCLRYRSSNMASCSHIWWQDWKCSECCKGDRCNYFIISGSSEVKSSAVFSLLPSLYTISRLFQ